MMRSCCKAFFDLNKALLVRNLHSKSTFCPFKERVSSGGSGLEFKFRTCLFATIIRRNLCLLTVDRYGYVSVSGRNKVNEDRCRITELKPGIKYFGVFDGHCGEFAGDFVNKKLPEIVTEEIDSFKLLNNDDYVIHGENMLRTAFEKCQNYLKDSVNSQDWDKKTKGKNKCIFL